MFAGIQFWWLQASCWVSALYASSSQALGWRSWHHLGETVLVAKDKAGGSGSVAQLCLTLYDPTDCSTSGFPVLYISRNLLKLMSIESVMPPNHLILCHPLLLPPSIFPIIRVFSNELAVHIRRPGYWSFSFNPSNEYSSLISFRIDWFDHLAVQGTLKSLLQHHSSKDQFFSTQPSSWSNSHIYTWLLEKS